MSRTVNRSTKSELNKTHAAKLRHDGILEKRIGDIHPAPENDDYEYDENSWTDVASNDYSAYIKSKTIAERAAWDF